MSVKALKISSIFVALLVLQGCAVIGLGGEAPGSQAKTSWSNRKIKSGSQVIGRIITPVQPPSSVPAVVIPDNQPVNQMLAQLSTTEKRCLQQRMERGRELARQIGEIFRTYGVPHDLINLALIESAFNPNAVSPQGAVGLWQFTKSTARLYGLVVNKKLDERRDVKKSTHAAAKLLMDLFDIYGDWNLALAAYNAGVGRVNRAIEKGGTTDFFEIADRGLLARETQEFVPRFLAVAKIARTPEVYGFDSPYSLALR